MPLGGGNNNLKIIIMENPILNTTLISRKEFESVLFSRFGLKLDTNSINMYSDNFACNRHAYSIESPLVFTATFLDSFGASWAQTFGMFYCEHTRKRTPLFLEFKKFVETHTFKYKNHFFI